MRGVGGGGALALRPPGLRLKSIHIWRCWGEKVTCQFGGEAFISARIIVRRIASDKHGGFQGRGYFLVLVM